MHQLIPALLCYDDSGANSSMQAGEEPDNLIAAHKAKHSAREEQKILDHCSGEVAQAASAVTSHPSHRNAYSTQSPSLMRYTFERADAQSRPDDGRALRDDLFAPASSSSFRGPTSMPDEVKVLGVASKQLQCSSAIGNKNEMPTEPAGRADGLGAAAAALNHPGSGVGSITGVPSGPSGSRHTSSNRPEPHIFISAVNLPAKPSLIKHVRRFFLKHGIQAVHMDAAGFYITFPDTDYGRRRLAVCAERTRSAVMFSQYHLRPEVFYDKRKVTDPRQLSAPSAVERSRSSSPGTSILGAAKKLNKTWPAAVVHDTQEPLLTSRPLNSSLDPQAPKAAIHVSDKNNSNSRQFPSVVAQAGASASPPADDTTTFDISPSRQPHNSTSSVHSGTTSSSRSKSVQCYVCKGLGGALSLCKTCARHYHNHCRPQGSTLDSFRRHWQCANCVWKGKPQIHKAIDHEVSSSAAEARGPLLGTVRVEAPINNDLHRTRDNRKSTPANSELRDAVAPITTPIGQNGRKAPVQQSTNLGITRYGSQQQSSETQSLHRNEHTDEAAVPDRDQFPIQERAEAADTNTNKLKRNAELDEQTADNDGHDSIRCPLIKRARRLVSDVDKENNIPNGIALDVGHTTAVSAAQRQTESAPLSLLESNGIPTTSSKCVTRASDHDSLDEAQDLVEKSFAAVDPATNKVNGPKKLEITRVKRQEPRKDPPTPGNEHNYIAVEQSPDRGLTSTRESQEPARGPILAQSEAIDVDTSSGMAEASAYSTGLIREAPNQRQVLEDEATLVTHKRSMKTGSPSNSLPQSKAPKPSGYARARRHKSSMKCSCGKSVPFNPSGKSECTACKEKSAKGTPIPEQAEIAEDMRVSPLSAVETVRRVIVPEAATKHRQGSPSHRALASSKNEIYARASSTVATGSTEANKVTKASERFDLSGQIQETGLNQVHDRQTASASEPSKMHLHMQPTEPTEHTEPTEPAEPTEPTEPTEPPEPPETSEIDAECALPLQEIAEGLTSSEVGDASPAAAIKKRQEECKSQKADDIDRNDLGDSFSRPDGTYYRLIGMALCAANANRATAQWILQWITRNIPNYALGEGKWAHNLRAVLSQNAVGKTGKSLVTSITVDSSSRAKRVVYELLPGLAEELERWDEVLQRPMLPLAKRQSYGQPLLGKAPEENIVAQKTLPTGNMRMPKAKTTKTTMDPVDDVMDVDNDEFIQQHRDQGADSDDGMHNEDWTTDAMRKLDAGMGRFAPQLSRREGSKPPRDSQPTVPVPGIRLFPAADLQKEASPPYLDEEEEKALLHMIREDHRTRNSTSRSLFTNRPQYDPSSEVKRQAKIVEISKRPRRKDIIGKPAGYSVLGWTGLFEERLSTTSRDVSPTKKNRGPPLLADDGTPIQVFRSLEDFLGLPDDLVPAIVNKQLVYRHKDGNKRAVYRTGI